MGCTSGKSSLKKNFCDEEINKELVNAIITVINDLDEIGDM